MIDKTELWIVIIGLAIGSFALRFAFLGIVGDKPMPDWMLRHLRYTAVAVLPALVAPLVVWPSGTDGQLDPARLAAALVTLGLGFTTRNVFVAMIGGALTLYGLLYLLGSG